MVYAALAVIAAVCAVQALRMPRLLPAAVWLAGASAAVSITLYLLGAAQVAVVELSVGAGLVTVLLVFAITMAGEEPVAGRSVVPGHIALILVAAAALLLLWLVLPLVVLSDAPPDDTTFMGIFWQARTADVLAQILLVFTGVLCLLGLMIEPPEPQIHVETAELVDTSQAQKPPDANLTEIAAEEEPA